MAEDRAILSKVFKLINEDASRLENNAGYDGARSDYGAGRLREQVKFYKAGMAGRIPPSWKDYHDKATKAVDPEWEEFQRLKNKFGE